MSVEVLSGARSDATSAFRIRHNPVDWRDSDHETDDAVVAGGH